jgi:CTP:molybdopterin cytidylyltransferase MocA
MLCDQWQVELPDLQVLAHAWFSDISGISSASWKSKKGLVTGPPAIFPRNLFHELICLKGDRGAKAVIEKYPERTSLIEIDNARFDLDVPDDLTRLPNSKV